MAERLLGVLLHDVVSVIRGDIGIDSEGADVERSPHRAPEQRAADDRDRLDLVQPDAAPTLRHGRDSTHPFLPRTKEEAPAHGRGPLESLPLCVSCRRWPRLVIPH